MDFTFTNGSLLQQQTFLDAVNSLLNFDLSKAPGGTVAVEFIADPSPSSHNEFAASFDEANTIKIRTDFPSFAPTSLWGSAGFAMETVIHEIAHQLTDNMGVPDLEACAALFGLPSGAFTDPYDTDTPWVDRPKEGFAETFKDAFMPPAKRAYSNRTNVQCPIHKYPEFRRIMRDLEAGNGDLTVYNDGSPIAVYTKELLEGGGYVIAENSSGDYFTLGGYDNSDEPPDLGLFSLASTKDDHPTIPNTSYTVVKSFIGNVEHVTGSSYGHLLDDYIETEAPVVAPGTYELDFDFQPLRDLFDDIALSSHEDTTDGEVCNFQVVLSPAFWEQNVYHETGESVAVDGMWGFSLNRVWRYYLDPGDTTGMEFVDTDPFGRDVWRELTETASNFDGVLSLTATSVSWSATIPVKTWFNAYGSFNSRNDEMNSPYVDDDDVRGEIADALAEIDPSMTFNGSTWWSGSGEGQDAPANPELESEEKQGASLPTSGPVHGGGDDFTRSISEGGEDAETSGGPTIYS